MKQELIDSIGAVRREVRACERDGRPARAIIAERTYDTTVKDVWDAITSRDRIPRWLAPIEGDLQLGGRYQVEGNAGGEITACDPPTHLAVTWELGGGVTWLDVHLSDGPGGTLLRLEHVALIDDLEQWGPFGPGAVGIGWDLALVGLAEHPGAHLPPDRRLRRTEQLVDDRLAHPYILTRDRAVSATRARRSAGSSTSTPSSGKR